MARVQFQTDDVGLPLAKPKEERGGVRGGLHPQYDAHRAGKVLCQQELGAELLAAVFIVGVRAAQGDADERAR